MVIKIGKRRITNNMLVNLKRRNGSHYLDILKRDKYACTECYYRDFVLVHHKDFDVKNNSPENLITLCKRCHAIAHRLTVRYTNPNINLILELRKQDKTYKEIGEYLGVSRQRIHQITKKLPP